MNKNLKNVYVKLNDSSNDMVIFYPEFSYDEFKKAKNFQLNNNWGYVIIDEQNDLSKIGEHTPWIYATGNNIEIITDKQEIEKLERKRKLIQLI